ncbi:MAG: His/Gly/Thr/Pro-type tRNA ligase C-terminal domain-containing protein [Candidatus Paceibacterota bacterium]
MKRKRRLSLPAARRKIDSLNGEISGAIKTCLEYDMPLENPPTLFFQTNQQNKKTGNRLVFGLHVLGTKESIAEALALKVATEIAYDLGIKDIQFRVNTMGDKDSSQKFTRDLVVYLRKNINALPAQAREAFKKDPFLALEILEKKEHGLFADIPKPMEYLSTDSRKHFREVLEYIETAEIPYELDDLLIKHRDCYSQTLFEARPYVHEGSLLSISGGRYDQLSRSLFGKEMPGVGIVFSLSCAKKVRPAPLLSIQKDPRVFFIHLGFEAKLKSLFVVEKLRTSRIPFYHSLVARQFSEELHHADELSVPYIVIMGQREALEDAVIVRNRETRAQEVVPIETLSDYLHTIRA